MLSNLFIQWNTQASNPTPSKRMALETRTPNNTHRRSRRTAPQESGDNSTKQGGMPKPPKVRQPKKTVLSPSADKQNQPTSLKQIPRTRTKPPAQRRLLTSALFLKPPRTEKARPIQVRALTTHTSHTHGTFGMATCTLSRQPNTWIDFEMINLFGGGHELLGLGICLKFLFFLTGKVRQGKVR